MLCTYNAHTDDTRLVRVNGLISAVHRFLVMQRIHALIYTRQTKCNMLKVRFMPKELGITHFYYKNLNILRLFFSLLFEQYFFSGAFYH